MTVPFSSLSKPVDITTSRVDPCAQQRRTTQPPRVLAETACHVDGTSLDVDRLIRGDVNVAQARLLLARRSSKEQPSGGFTGEQELHRFAEAVLALAVAGLD